jgi:transposase
MDLIAELGSWKGYRVARISHTSPSQQPRAEVIIELTPDPSAPLRCGECGATVMLYHDVTERRVRDLPLFDYQTVLVVPRRRVWCPQCRGPKSEALDWLEPYARHTTRFAESVCRLADLLPIAHVARYFGLSWSTVQQLHRRHLERQLGPVDLTGVTAIAMDEFAIHKGHRYATVIADAQTRRVLWLCEGKRRVDVRPFFEALGRDGCQAITAVAMDMNSAFDLEVRAHCPNAAVVYDKFHVLAKYNREVVDRVRVDRANELRDDRPARKVVKRSKWLLLKRRDRLKDQDRVRLEEILEANQPLAVSDIMREGLRGLWDQRDPEQLRQDWMDWIQQARESGVKPLATFARRLTNYLDGLVAFATHRLTTGFLEGINNTIKVIKRRAYGYRDQAYFFLRIRAQFPGYQPRAPGIP